MAAEMGTGGRSRAATEISSDGGAGRQALVIGGGTMGIGIVQVLLESGAAVHLVDTNPAVTASAHQQIADGLRRGHGAGDGDHQLQSVLGRLTVSTDVDLSLEQLDLAVEAVIEDLAVKAAVLGPVATRYPGALVATNTSSLSISALAADLVRPERCIGMHFFNPVPRSTLVEVVVGSATAPETVARAHQWVAVLGKESIQVQDSPGFATSRLGLAIGLEAIRMVEEGVSSAEDIDKGMVLGYRFPVGPLWLTDLVGLDVRLAIADHLAATLGPRFAAPALLHTMVEEGRLGKKAGQGFYLWP